MATVGRRGGGAPPVDAAAVEAARLLHGVAQVSCLAGTRDKRQVRLDGGAVLGYRAAARVAVVAGDPLAPEAARGDAVRAFVAGCRAAHRWPCFLQTCPSMRAAYRAAGLRLLHFGAEAMVDLQSFCLDAPARANLRHEVTHAQRCGLCADTYCWDEVPASLWQELREVSDAWLRTRPFRRELGFSVGRFGETVDGAGLLTVVRDSQGQVQAFTSWLHLNRDGIALDMFRRRPDATRGAMELCIVSSFEAASRRGLRQASLGVAPFRDCGDAVDEGRLVASLRRRLFRHGTLGYDYRGLARFKGKFAPRWEARDLAVPRGLGGLLVPVALALVHLAPGAQGEQRGDGEPGDR